MKKGCLIGLVLAGTITISGLVSGFTLLSHRNVAVELEESIQAQYIANKSNYDSMVKSAKEMVQVTDMYADDFERIYTDLISGRNQDTNLLFKVIHESNPNLDSTVYTTLQRELSANRKTFDKNQATISDKIREYNTYIKKKFIMAAITNRKAMNADKFIVTSDSTEKTFEAGISDEINLRGE